jgi:transposase InsO family protein
MADVEEETEAKQPKTTDEKIEAIFTDRAGFGSLKQTISDVKVYYPEIKRAEVEKWYRKNVEYNILNRGSNSFVASKPLQVFQIDLFNMKSKSGGDAYSMAIGCIDIFTKYAVVIALHNKQADTLLDGLKQIFKLMEKPKVLMTDEEGGLQSKQVGEYLRKEGITYIINRNHAPFIERFIRTFRNMVSRRLQKREDRWYDMIFEILLTYNRKMVSSATGYTPNDAKKPENRLEVRMNMEDRAKREKRYDDIQVGDKVRVFRKRKHLSEKESTLLWSKVAYEVVKVDDNPNAGKLYYIAGNDKPFIRSQILKVRE